MSSDPTGSSAPPLEGVDLRPLLDSCEELAKRWLMGLVAARPLHDVGALPLERFARRAPAICGEVVRALASDAALARLRAPAGAERERAPGPGALESTAAILGAGGPAELVDAIEALRAALWGELARHLGDVAPEALGPAADRLAHACSVLSASVLEEWARRPPGEVPAGAQLAPDETPAGSLPDVSAPRPPTSAAAEWPQVSSAEYPRIGPRPRERRDAGEDQDVWEILDETPSEAAPADRDAVADEPEQAPAARPAGWSAPIAPEIVRDTREGSPFAVLLIDVVDVERLRSAAPMAELDSLMRRVHDVLAGELRPSDRLAQEGAGRWWLVAPETHAPAAKALAERLAGAVRASVSHRGAPLEVAIGVASSPADGDHAEELAERAEEALYSARATGVPVAPVR
jgi:diguanylate cyclase (GGDEF)-like protein